MFDDTKGYNVLFITFNDKGFGFGSNDFGVCGLGHEVVVKELQLIEELCDKCVQQFYSGSGFALALTSDNKLFGWGANDFGQLGINMVNHTKLYKPILIEDLQDVIIKQISCGSLHTLVLTFDGSVYCWGNNTYGQIGYGKQFGDKIKTIVKLESLPKTKLVHCSYCQSFAVTQNGWVYSWGQNKFCHLGHELRRNESVFEPKLITNLINITSVCSSNSNTYFLSNEGNIYFCGKYYDRSNKQCYQLLPNSMDLPITVKLKTMFNTFGLSNRSIHSKLIFQEKNSIAVIVINNIIYKLNHSKIEKTNYQKLEEFYFQEYHLTYETIDLNNDIIEEEIIESITETYIDNNVPISIEILKSFTICNNSNINNFSIKYINIFDDQNGFNVLFVTNDDNVYGFGSNQFGSCGLGHNKSVKDPKIIPELCDKNIQQFFNGFSFVLGLTCDNELYGWGRNKLYQLANSIFNYEYNKPIIINIENKIIRQISCGSAHTLVLTSDGQVFGWGYNSYGQIGCGIEMGNKILVTQLTSLSNIKLIHCSFGQSFAVTDNGMVYSWGHNNWSQLGHELKQNECVFEPKLIRNLSNITSICSSNGCTYFLSNEGNIYFCGKCYDKNGVEVNQIVPKLLSNQVNIDSLHSLNCYRRMSAIGCAISDECVYYLNHYELEKSNYKILEEFYSNECQLTYKTYYLKLMSELQKNKIKINRKPISNLFKKT